MIFYTRQEWFDKLSDKLTEVFGKNTFSEEELDREFYTEFFIRCSDFFRNEEGIIDHEAIWDENLRKWLISSDKKIL